MDKISDLCQKLRNGEYDGYDIMQCWILLEQMKEDNEDLKSELKGYRLEEDRIIAAQVLAKQECPSGSVNKFEVDSGCIHISMYSNSMDYSAGTEWYTYTFEDLDRYRELDIYDEI